MALTLKAAGLRLKGFNRRTAATECLFMVKVTKWFDWV
jgi:hypothetical protein